MSRLGLAVLVVCAIQAQAVSVAYAFPLSNAERSCAAGLTNESAKTVSAYGKEVVGCVRAIGRETAGSPDPATCVAADSKGKLLRARTKVAATVAKKCTALPYPMDCPLPCAAADLGGATGATDDTGELTACLQCMSPAVSWSGQAPTALKGFHEALLDGVTLATITGDAALADCQGRVVKRAESLFKAEVKGLVRCAKTAFRDATEAPLECLQVAIDSSKASKALAKVAVEAQRCPGTVPFDAGACANLSVAAGLSFCVDTVAHCSLCRWAGVVLGAEPDCDWFDDGQLNGSCAQAGSVSTTTTTIGGGTTTTTIGGGTTTTTIGGGTTTTTIGGGTTTTTIGGGTTTTTLPPLCGGLVNSWGELGSAAGQFNDPHGIAIDSAGNVYAADTGNNRIQKFTAAGAFVTAWGSLGAGNGQFNAPSDVAVDAAGSVYVTDSVNHRVQKFTSSGSFVTAWGVFGTSNGQFDTPRGIAAATSGDIYVGDSHNDRIQFFSPTGAFIGRWGSFGQGGGEFDRPRGLATQPTGEVYVADRSNNRVQRFTSAGAFLGSWGVFGAGDGQFVTPRYVAIDAFGDVYVADSGSNRIQKFDSVGGFITKWGSFGSGLGQLNLPRGLAIAADANIYSVDAGNHRIQVFSCE